MATASKAKQAPAVETSWDKYEEMQEAMEMPDVKLLDCWGIPYMEENLLDASCNGIESLQDEVDEREAQGHSLLAFAKVNQVTLAVYRQMHDEMQALYAQDELPNNVEQDPIGYFLDKYAPMLWSRRKKAGIFKGQDDWSTVHSTLQEVRAWFGLK